ncbi:MAG: 3'(2'),5'-bisphosphate nucleotidase CysQ [Candidatus Nitronauta litoralis]|uniref:3'(2'),5'-bisphosphate nucleotidase CysQ n=1 Tax=Candidatus Nitronauta litoralis TaxID=2705533 RepID=A0A7T0BZ29_9BACT|nr:MAG: 3'(2'),5'-bisphosphate nucleotidase CysQ [Candidatus Nitronauta litoralis]
MQVYDSNDYQIQIKEDGTPVTRADLIAHDYITKALKHEFGYPVISEEAPVPPYEERQTWSQFFLVDPVDGTRDFIAKNDEFTVNIALVSGGEPVLGVVLVPAKGELFFARKGKGAWMRTNNSEDLPLPLEKQEGWVLARSWHHDNSMIEAFAKNNNISQSIKMSSAIRLARLSQGKVNLCVVSNKSKEWDIAAGQVILKETGGSIVEMESGKEPAYNKPDMQNAFSLATASGVSLSQLKL